MNDSTIRCLCPDPSEIYRLRAGTAGLVATNIKVRLSRSGTESAWLGLRKALSSAQIRAVRPKSICAKVTDVCVPNNNGVRVIDA